MATLIYETQNLALNYGNQIILSNSLCEMLILIIGIFDQIK